MSDDFNNDVFLLIDAAKSGDIQTIKSLIDSGIDVNIKNPIGYSALMCAAGNGYNDLVTFLLKCGADVNAKANNGMTVLMNACFCGDPGTGSVTFQS